MPDQSPTDGKRTESVPPANRDLKSETPVELRARLDAWGEPAYRAEQITQWVYARGVGDWEDMTNLPKPLRARLRSEYTLHAPEPVRVQGTPDSTRKFLWRLRDGALIESVLIPANPALYGEGSDRFTLCISTQVGCAYGCRFCASGIDGFKRDLGSDEIVSQVLATEKWHAAESPTREAAPAVPSPGHRRTRLIDNIVVMGMGEPLANYANLIRALTILNAPWGLGIGARKITVSTSGLCPQIRRLAEEPLQLGLAISLHGATDEVRSRIMPINRRFPLRALLAACEYYQARKGRMITFEYILIAGVNDGLDQVKPLAELARRARAKVNLIPYNTVESLTWRRPEPAVQEAFLKALEARGGRATLRREKGHDIDAACGQLRLKTEQAAG